MPLQACAKNKKPGYKWGKSGNCYTYSPGDKKSRQKAKARALKQARAIFSSGYGKK